MRPRAQRCPHVHPLVVQPTVAIVSRASKPHTSRHMPAGTLPGHARMTTFWQDTTAHIASCNGTGADTQFISLDSRHTGTANLQAQHCKPSSSAQLCMDISAAPCKSTVVGFRGLPPPAGLKSQYRTAHTPCTPPTTLHKPLSVPAATIYPTTRPGHSKPRYRRTFSRARRTPCLPAEPLLPLLLPRNASAAAAASAAACCACTCCCASSAISCETAAMEAG